MRSRRPDPSPWPVRLDPAETRAAGARPAAAGIGACPRHRLIVGHLLAGSCLGGQTVSRLIILAVVDSYALCAALLCVARMLLSPGASRLRLFHLRDTAAAYLMCWIRRLILIAVFGYAIGEVGLLLGLSRSPTTLLQKAVGLMLHVLLAIMSPEAPRGAPRGCARRRQHADSVAALRNRFARGLALGRAVHSCSPRGWSGRWRCRTASRPLLHYFVVTALVLIGARLAASSSAGRRRSRHAARQRRTARMPILDARAAAASIIRS